MELFSAAIDGEINCAAFSPDGIHLALSRNDNHTHIYDSRKLNRLLFDFEHSGPCRKSPGSESYGVVHAEWVERDSRRLPVGLLTGGHDGTSARNVFYLHSELVTYRVCAVLGPS